MAEKQFKWPIPAWVGDIEDAECRSAALLRFHISLAALYANPSGELKDLAQDMGVTSNVVRVARTRGQIAGHQAVNLEKILGRELFPRELFKPSLFSTEA